MAAPAVPVPTGTPLPSVLANTLDQLKKACKGMRDDEQLVHGVIVTLRGLGYIVPAPVPAGKTVGLDTPQQWIAGPAMITLYEGGAFPPGQSSYAWLDSPDKILQAVNGCEILDFYLGQQATSTSIVGQLTTPTPANNDQPYLPLVAISLFGIVS